MSTETPEPIRPQIWHALTDRTQRWEFYQHYGRDDPPAWETFTINSMGFYREDLHIEPSAYRNVRNVRYIATQDESGTWRTTRAFADIFDNKVHVHAYDTDELYADRMAFPIDPRMTQLDIDGATHIYKNEDNTGWLFAHATPGKHHDHEINLISGIDGLMQPMFRQYHVDVITGANFEAKNRAANLFALLSTFYGEVIGIAKTNARAKYLGEREQKPLPVDGHILVEAKTAFEAIIAKWKANRPADANKLTTAFTYITNALAIPDPETRWDKEARIKAAKKAEEAASTESSENP